MSIIDQRRLARLQLLAGLALCGVGCGSNDHSGFGNPGTFGGSSSSGGGSGSGGSSGSNSGSGSGSQTGFGTSSGGSSGANAGDGGDDCAPGVGLYIYVISDQNTLYTFDPTMVPNATAFQMVGPVNCPAAAGASVNSMAVDRQGMAWVNYGSPDGKIYKVTTTAPVTCTATSFANQQAGFTNELGMGFSSDATGSTSETLYVSDNAGPGGVGGPEQHGHAGSRQGPRQGGPDDDDVDADWRVHRPKHGVQRGAYGNERREALRVLHDASPGDYSPIDKTTGATSMPVSLPTVNASTWRLRLLVLGRRLLFLHPTRGHRRRSRTTTRQHRWPRRS